MIQSEANVIMMTAVNGRAVAQLALNAGAFDYIVKPIDYDDTGSRASPPAWDARRIANENGGESSLPPEPGHERFLNAADHAISIAASGSVRVEPQSPSPR